MNHDSESDSLEFESADEDIKGEDVNLSELELDDDLNVTPNKKEQTQNDSEGENEKTLELSSNNISIHKSEISSTNKIDPILKDEKKKNKLNIEKGKAEKLEAQRLETEKLEAQRLEAEKLEAQRLETEKLEAQRIEAEAEDKLKSSKKFESKLKAGWDDTELSDLEDADLEDKDEKVEPKSQQIDSKSNISKSETKENKAGWDDTELSELEDNDLQEATISKKSIHSKSFDISTSQFKSIDKSKSEFFETKKLEESQNEQKEATKSAGWSWSKFGSNFITSATSSVANLTNQLGTGLNTVLETVESTLGAPDPAELAAKIAKTKSLEKEAETTDKDSKSLEKNDWNNEDDDEWFSLPQLNKLATTGTQLVAGSLDVLETVGKRTIEVINDKDPNLKQTREFLKKVPVNIVPITSKPNLSQLLREAQQAQTKKEDNQESLNDSNKAKSKPLKKQEKLTFSLFFDEYKGVAHLEALEMLSSQASVKLEMLLIQKSNKNSDSKKKLDLLEELFEADNLNDDSDNQTEDASSFLNDFNLLLNNKDKMFDIEHFEFIINDYAKKSSLKLIIDKVIGSYRTTSLASKEIDSPVELLNESIKCFALITSKIIELYHKAAEALLIDQQNNKKKNFSSTSIVENAQVLYQITKLCIRSVTILSDDYSRKCRLGSKDKSLADANISASQITTDIYLEASNSTTYIGDAFLLFLPIFKSQLLESDL